MQYSHLSLCVVLSKMLCSIVTESLKRIFPIPKPKEVYSKPFICDDFRGIAISPVLAKTFEHCILVRFASFFSTSPNQFGFKKGVGCSHAIRSVRRPNIVDSFIQGYGYLVCYRPLQGI